MNVIVDAPEGAFPEGTVMVVKDVQDEGTLRNIEQSVAGDFVEVTSVHAVDISFWYNDTEIEPLLPIAVVMSAVEGDAKSETPVVVHVADNGETSVVDSESIGATEAALEMPATENPEAQAFEADSFSVYAIVGTQALVKNYIDDSGKTWRIKVGYTESAGLPEGARLEVAEIKNSESYMAEAEAALEEGKRITKARFFDIRIMDTDGNEVQPREAVQVTVTMLGDEGEVEADAKQTDVGAPEVLAMHFVERNDEIVKVVSKNATESGDSVTFTAEGFSPWGVVYTVDFEYTNPETGKKVAWSWPGKGSYKVADIMYVLDVVGEINNVNLVRTIDVGGAENALYLENKEDGWYLTSDVAFEDTFKMSVTVDGKVYDIIITDDVDANPNLNDFLSDITFSETIEDNNVKKGRTYHMHLSFVEIGNKQFATTGLTYTMPEGINISQLDGNFSITYKGTTYSGNTYSYDPNTRKFAINFSDTVKNLIAISPDAQFTMDIVGEFMVQKDSYDFGNDKTRNFILDDVHDTSIQKSGYYDSNTNKVYYTVVAKSDGVSENVVITDNISGTALKYERGSIQINGNSATPTISENDNGFSVSLPSMGDTETVTITYSASVDFGKLTGKGTVTQTGNTVTIQAKDDPLTEVPTDLNNRIDYNPLKKTAGEVTGDGNTKTVPWTITVNEQQLKSMSGTTITDTIGYNSRDIMKYSGAGITVKVVDHGYTVDTYTVPWSDLYLDETAKPQSWHYKLPVSGDPHYNNDDDSTYMYVITYTTEVDATGKITNFSVDNKVTDDENHEGTNGATVGPGADVVTFNKKNTGYSAAVSNWEISFNVPKSGLKSAIVKDTLPNNGMYFDELLGDIVITGLLDGESYTIDTSNPKEVLITFYKSGEKTDENKGLQASASDREIKVSLTTKNNPDWVIAYSGDDHWNYAELNVDGQVITDKDKSNPVSEGISKTGSYFKTVEINGRQYPVFKYTVSLYGVNDDSFSGNPSVLTFVDDYDERYLKLYYEPANYSGDLLVKDKSGNTDATDYSIVGYNENGGKVTFTARKTQFKKDGNGMYSSVYTMDYYLIVKEDADNTFLNALELASINAADKDYYVAIDNSVQWGTYNDSVTIDYKYPAVDKKILSSDGSKREAKFEIVLNPDKLTLNGGDAMELQDSAENLSIDYSTIQIETDPASAASDITYYYRGNTGYFSIPDSTKVTLRYTARIIGDGSVTYSNEAILKGFRDSTTKTESVSSSASGSLNIEWVLIYKHAFRKMEKPLNGAEYVLTDRNGNPILYPASAQTFTDVNGVEVKPGYPVIFRTHYMDVNDTPDGQGTSAGKKTADYRNGYAWVFLDRAKTGLALQKGITYYMKEYKAPTGYQKDDTIYTFTIAEHPDYTDYEYYSGDILRIADSPVDGVLEIRKTLDGTHNLTDTQKKQITFEITAVDSDGEAMEFPYSRKSDDEYLCTDKLTVSYADFVDGVYRLEALPYGTYTVKETGKDLDGYVWKSTTYTVDDVTKTESDYSGSVSIIKENKEHTFEYTNSYEKQKASVNIVKKDSQNTIFLYGATFQLMKWNGLEWEKVNNSGLDANSEFTIDFESRTTGVTITNLENGSYRLVEITAPRDYVLDGTPVYFTVSDSGVAQGGQGTNGSNVLSFANNEKNVPTFAIKNEIDHTYTLNKVDALRLRRKLAGAQFEVYEVLAASGGEVTLSEQKVFGPFTTDENGQAVIDTKTGYDPTKLYAVKETKAPAGYKATDKLYYFYTGTNAPHLASTVKGWGESVVELHDGPKESTVPNEEDNTKLFVKKLWYGINGTQWANMPPASWGIDEIEVRLMQQTVDEDTGDVISTKQYPDNDTTYMLTVGGGGQTNWLCYKWNDLPSGNSVNTEAPVIYKYYVEEVNQNDYKAYYILTTNETDNSLNLADASDEGSDALGDSDHPNIAIVNLMKPLTYSVKKVWLDDGSNRPGSVNVGIRYSDKNGTDKQPTQMDLLDPTRPSAGQDTSVNLDLNDANNWSHTWEYLYPGELDNPRTYYVVETNLGSDYTCDLIGPNESGLFVMTNTKTTSDKLKVKKVWLNEDGTPMTPEEITSDGSPVEVQLQRIAGKFEGINVAVKKNNYDITTKQVASGSDFSFTITVKQVEGPAIDFVPTVDNGTMELTSSVNPYGEVYFYTYTVSVYDITEEKTVNVDTSQITGIQDWQIEIGNYTYTDPSMSVKEGAELQDVGTDVVSEPRVTLNSSNNWMKDWGNNLPKDAGGGYQWFYSVREVNVPAGFDVSYENNDGIQTGLIYVKNAVSQYTRATAKKEWQDSTGATIAAPSGASVVYTLYQDGKKTSQTVTLDGTVDEDGEFNAWEATFEGLEKRKANGEPHIYTVRETVGHTGYVALNDTAENGGTIINKEVRSLTAIKKWLDSNGNPMEPPVGVTSVTVVLYKDGQSTGREVTLDGRPDKNGEERAWEATFNSLDNDGTYTVGETNVTSGYSQVGDIEYELADGTKNTAGITAPNTGKATITNKEAEKGALKVAKTFNGITYSELTAEQKAALEKVYFTVTDSSDTEVATVYLKVDADNMDADLTKTIDNLVPGDYTVTENIPDDSTPSGYLYKKTTVKVNNGAPVETVTASATVSANTVTNVTYVNDYGPATADLTVTKRIDKANSATEDVTFYVGLFANATATKPIAAAEVGGTNPQPITFTAGSADISKTATFTGLTVGTTYYVFETDSTGRKVTTADKTNGYAIEASDEEGISVSIQPGGSTAEITNTYSATGSVPFKAKKTLEGGDLTADQFSFTLVEYTDNTFQTVKDGGVSQSKGNAIGGDIAFDEVALADTATRYFKIKETVPTGQDADGSIIYDTHETNVTVTVTDDGKGNLVYAKNPAAVEQYDATFVNTKKGALTITKAVTVNGADVADNTKASVADGKYTFTVTGPDDYSYTGDITVTNGVATSSISLTNLTPGEYTVTEATPTNGTAISKINAAASSVYNTTVTVQPNQTETVAYTNDIETAKLTVEKKWLLNGTPTTDPKKFDGSVISAIDFNLFQKKPGALDGTQYGDTYTISSDNGWKIEIDVPKYVWDDTQQKNVSVSYYLQETTALDHYNTTITSNSVTVSKSDPLDVDSDKDVTITNSLYTVALPSTGGVGTGVVYGAGAALILLALLGLVLMNRKRSRGTGI